MKNKLVRFAELLEKKGFSKLSQILLAQVGIEPPMSGAGYTEYHLTGNEYPLGRDPILSPEAQASLNRGLEDLRHGRFAKDPMKDIDDSWLDEISDDEDEESKTT